MKEADRVRIVVSVGSNDAAPWNAVSREEFAAHLHEAVDGIGAGRWVYVGPPGVDAGSLLHDLGADAFTDDGVHLTGAAYDRLLPAIADSTR